MRFSDFQKYLEEENQKHSEEFQDVPKEAWPHRWTPENGQKPFRLLRNRHFLVQVYQENHGIHRITVNRTQLESPGRWVDGITWDQLYKIKNEIGYEHYTAVEIYPRAKDLVNDANMRHLFVYVDTKNLPDFIWRRGL